MSLIKNILDANFTKETHIMGMNPEVNGCFVSPKEPFHAIGDLEKIHEIECELFDLQFIASEVQDLFGTVSYVLENHEDMQGLDFQKAFKRCMEISGKFQDMNLPEFSAKEPSRDQVIENLRCAIQQAEQFGLVRIEDGKPITGAIDSESGIVLTSE